MPQDGETVFGIDEQCDVAVVVSKCSKHADGVDHRFSKLGHRAGARAKQWRTIRRRENTRSNRQSRARPEHAQARPHRARLPEVAAVAEQAGGAKVRRAVAREKSPPLAGHGADWLRTGRCPAGCPGKGVFQSAMNDALSADALARAEGDRFKQQRLQAVSMQMIKHPQSGDAAAENHRVDSDGMWFRSWLGIGDGHGGMVEWFRVAVNWILSGGGKCSSGCCPAGVARAGDSSYNPPAMGQVALGLRSLIVKLAVFVVMAALLAWALGGTLWPRAEQIRTEGVSFSGGEWYWRLSVGGADGEAVRWHLVKSAGENNRVIEDRPWLEAAGLAVADGVLFAAGRPSWTEDHWLIREIDESGEPVADHPVPDRLAVEQQLARIRHGLPLQDVETILRQRAHVLDPIDNGANGASE